MNNDPISDILMKVQGNCPNCGTTLTFKESALLAKDNGIKEDAVMCHNCKKVYTVNLTLHDMSFLDEIPTNFSNNNDNYSQEFKEYVDKMDYENAMQTLQKWREKNPNDANVYYAGIIMAVGNDDVKYDELKVLKDLGDNSKAGDDTLNKWFRDKADTALNIVKNKEETPDYALIFKNYYDSKQYEEAIKHNKTWINEDPNDANVYYAGIIMAAFDDSISSKDMQTMQNVGDKKQAVNTGLSQWFKNESLNAIQKQKEREKPSVVENTIKNTSINNNNNYQNNHNNYQNQISNNNIPQQSNTTKEDNSIFALFFYKKDKITNRYRISKTKTISILLFLLLFIMSLTITAQGLSSRTFWEDLFISIIVCLIFALIITIPVFVIGYVISYLIDKNKANNDGQRIKQPVQNTQTINTPQQQQPTDFIPRTNTPINNTPLNNTPEQTIETNNTPINNTPEQVNETITSENNYFEKDNLGTRHDSIEKANGYWLGERFNMAIKPPFTIYIFKTAQEAEDALLELPYIHKASDTGNLICDKVFQFGYYKVSENNYEAIVCGKDLSYDEFIQAEEAFKKHNGTLKNNLEPEKTTTENSTAKKGNGVRFREKIQKNQFTYECYDADTKEEAQEFLKGKTVTERLYYICVYTPEGDYGRDIDGIYQM